MRLFIGIPCTERVRRQIRQGVAGIHPYFLKGKLSNWETYHITLKFLGEVSEEKAEALIRLMADARWMTAPFDLQFTELGAFHKRGGDVLWLGMVLPPPLLALQQEVEALMVQTEFEPENRAYSPHLTLARGVRYTEGFEALPAHWSVKGLQDRVEQVVLFQSTQVDGKLTYVPLATSRLR